MSKEEGSLILLSHALITDAHYFPFMYTFTLRPIILPLRVQTAPVVSSDFSAMQGRMESYDFFLFNYIFLYHGVSKPKHFRKEDHWNICHSPYFSSHATRVMKHGIPILLCILHTHAWALRDLQSFTDSSIHNLSTVLDGFDLFMIPWFDWLATPISPPVYSLTNLWGKKRNGQPMKMQNTEKIKAVKHAAVFHRIY